MKRPLIKWGLYGLTLCALLLVQVTYLQRRPLWHVTLQPIPALVVAVAVWEGPAAGAAFGYVAGLLCGLPLPRAESYLSLVLMSAGFVTGFLCRHVFRPSLPAAWLCAAGTLFVSELFYFVLFALIPGRAGFSALPPVVLLRTALSSLAVLPLYPLCRALSRRFARQAAP